MKNPALERRDLSAQKVAQPRDPNRRSQVMATRVTPIEQHHILMRAGDAHISPSDYLRRAALGATMQAVRANGIARLPPTYVPLVRELNAIGVNLNQLTRIGNASGYLPSGIEATMDEINTVLEQLIKLERT